MSDNAKTTSRHTRADVLIIGAGPAGLSAAAHVVRHDASLRVAVVDMNNQPGGQYWRHPDEQHFTGDASEGHHGWKTYLKLRENFDKGVARDQILYLPNTQIWLLKRQPSGQIRFFLSKAHAAAPDLAYSSILADRVIVATGGYDRQLPIPGWDLPGAYAAGAVQALLKSHRTLAGKRFAVAGTGPFLLPVATQIADAGGKVVGIFEAGGLSGWIPHIGAALGVPAKGIEGAQYVASLARHRIGYHRRSVITNIHGDTHVTGVTVAKRDRNGRINERASREYEVDAVALGWGFSPSMEIATNLDVSTQLGDDGSLVGKCDLMQRSESPGVYLAGEVTGVGGAPLAVAEGKLAALAVLHDVGRLDASKRKLITKTQMTIRKQRAFARAMHLAHPVPGNWEQWLTPETTICRCEEVSYADACYARDELLADDARSIKLFARTGMGWCQGRVCGFATSHIATRDTQKAGKPDSLEAVSKRTLSGPVSLNQLANVAEFEEL